MCSSDLLDNNDEARVLPLHICANGVRSSSGSNALCVFQIVFELGFRYYPTEMGFLFHKNNASETPFQIACNRYTTKKVLEVVDDVVKGSRDIQDAYNPIRSLIYASINDGIHTEGVYMLIRKEPDLIHKLLSNAPTVATSSTMT